MQTRVASVVLTLSMLLALPSPARAVDLSGQSRSYLQARETTNSSTQMPFLEYLDFKAEDLGTKSFSFHFGGWLRYDLNNDTTRDRSKSNSDLQYAYLRLRGERANATANLGRILVNEGVASEQIDGIHVKAALLGGFGIAAFGGVPVETDFDGRNRDSVYGGRISHGVDSLYRIGVSALIEKNTGTNFRKEQGVDLWFKPFSKIELLGNSFYNATTSAWMIHSYALTLGPFAGLRLTGSASQVSYADYFTSSTTSAFTFDPTFIDPKEKLTTTGVEAAYTFSGPVTLSADYKKYDYLIAGPADYSGGKLSWSVPKKGSVGLSSHRMNGETSKLRYHEYRLYAKKYFGKFDIAADYLNVRYDEKINDIRNASAAVLAAGYAVTGRLRFGADVEYARNPYYDRDVRGFIKLVYNFDTTLSSSTTRRK